CAFLEITSVRAGFRSLLAQAYGDAGQLPEKAIPTRLRELLRPGWPGLRRTVLEAGVAMESGESVDDAFRSIEQYMEGTWRRRLAAAQYAGRTDRGFLELAIVWKSEFRRSVENFLRILPIFVLLIVGGVILAWALSTIGGMYDQVLLR
ncbi:MAG: hypothetical protein MK538_18115, partial [Planctomycetes bacterium]|nr:hypothetical protein [Planctomycetota bacterium]